MEKKCCRTYDFSIINATAPQNHHEQLSADRDDFSKGSIPNPLSILLTFPLEVLDLLSMI